MRFHKVRVVVDTSKAVLLLVIEKAQCLTVLNEGRFQS